tara:strand:- start:943 stop:5595 length:4653 start_codon:yes stop_codon:yes gene_type:complete
MRSRAVLLIVLMMGMSVSPIAMADSTISSSTTWSGNVVLSGNVTVDASTTLVIESGTVVDAQSYWLQIDGTLEASDAQFMTTETSTSPGSTGAGLWGGIKISYGGSAVLSNVSISGAESALEVHGDATIHESISIMNSYIGFDIGGSGMVDAENVTMSTIDIQSVVNHGILTIDTALITNTATGILSTNDLTIDDVSFFETGVAIDVVSGSADISGLGLENVSVGIGSDSGASTTATSIYGQHVSLLIDGTDADDLTVSNALVSGDRLLWGSVESISLSDMNFTQENPGRSAIDLRCSIDCTFDNIYIHNADIGIDVDGTGTTTLTESEIHADQLGLRASGTGLLVMESSVLKANETAFSISSVNTELTDTTISLHDGVGPVAILLEGEHQWDDVEVTKPYSSLDTQSVGLDVWYSTIHATSLTTDGFAYGAELEDSTLIADDGSFINGKLRGLHAIDSQVSLGSMTTTAQEYGLVLSESSKATIADWTANLHNTPLLLEEGSVAHVRTFTPLNTAQGSSDAVGDGTFLYGGPTTTSVSTTDSGYLYETFVSFVDMNNQPIQATSYAHGFETTADTNGVASLPLLASGTVVEALYNGQGVSKELFGNQQGQTVQVITLPEGDWNLPSSTTIVLGARPDGQPHQLNGNLNFGSNSHLKLIDTTLMIDSSSAVDLGPSGTLSGDNGVLNASSLTLSVQSTLLSEGEGLELQSPVQWSCSQMQNIADIRFMSTITLAPLCEVEMIGGQANEAITIGTGASFSLVSTLQIEVLDKGIGVEGATIIVDGQTVQTDILGQVTAQTTARTVDAQGDVQEGTKTVTMQIGSFTEFYAWNVQQSTSHTFMASTVPTGTVTSWLVLEKSWSPYRLEGDLTIAPSTKMTVNDGVELRISSNAIIDVQGIFEAGASTISSTGFGARWGGLLLDGIVGSRIDLSGTVLTEGSPLLTMAGLGDASIQGAHFARSAGGDPLISILATAQSSLTMTDSDLRDAGSMCIQSQSQDATLTLHDVSLTDCNGDGLWARLSSLDVQGLNLGAGLEDGIDLTGTTGQVRGIDSSSFDGAYVVRMQSIDAGFHLSDSDIYAGESGGVFAFMCEDVNFRNLSVWGAPGIDLDETSGNLYDLTLDGENSGVGLTIRHGITEPVVLEEVQILDYSVGLKLHAHDFEEPAPVLLTNASIQSVEAISVEFFDLRMSSSTIQGDISISSSRVDAVDTTRSGSESIDSDGLLNEWSTHSLHAVLGGEVVEATYSINSDLLTAAVAYSGSFIDVELLHTQTTFEGSSTTNEATVEALSSMSLPTLLTFPIGQDAAKGVQIVLLANQAPDLSIQSPYSGQRHMETMPVEVSISVSDDTTVFENISINWQVFDAQNQLVKDGQSTSIMFNISNLDSGLFVVSITATDNLGLTSMVEVDIEVTQLDTDGDWTSSCSSDTWFDAVNGLQCGPDIYDPDDDNDGRLDENDVWPKDPCAWLDTDEDGQPDRIECPPGFTTSLFEDQDDDGDGTPDELEGSSMGNSEDNSTPIIFLGAILILVLIIFFIRIRGGGPKSLGEIDERML